jgi:hypothetical protein
MARQKMDQESNNGEREMMTLMRRLVEAVEYLAYHDDDGELEDEFSGQSLSDVVPATDLAVRTSL